MCRKHLILVFTAFLIIALAGCGIRQILPSKKVPPLDSYSTVVLLPFDFKKPSAEHAKMPTLISYAVGTKLKLRQTEKSWVYDQSQEIKPVSKKLAELNASAKDIYEAPLTAIKVAEAFQADLIIIGQLEKPKLTREDSGKITYDMKDTSQLGAARYYTVHQTATLPVKVKIVDVKRNEVIWDGSVIGFKRYATRYRTGEAAKFQRDERMLADIRKDLVEKLVEKFYPKGK